MLSYWRFLGTREREEGMPMNRVIWVTASLLVAFCFFHCAAAPLEYTYSIEAPQKVVAKPGILNDGNTKEFTYWKGERGVIVCELPATAEIAEAVVTLRKVTNWYLMHEVEVALDRDGSGEFTKPKAAPVPIPMYDGKPPVVDASCTNLTVRIPIGAKAVRVKVVVKSHAWGALSEIVLDDGKPVKATAAVAQPSPDKPAAKPSPISRRIAPHCRTISPRWRIPTSSCWCLRSVDAC